MRFSTSNIKRRRLNGGFTIAEVAIALMLLFCMIVIFGASVPVSLQASRSTGDYTTAEGIAHQKIEQLRAAGFANLNQGQLSASNIIDTTQPPGYPNTAPIGFPTGSVSYSFTTCEQITTFYPAGATGILTIAPDPNAPAGQAYDITVTISWTPASGASQSYSDRAIIANV